MNERLLAFDTSTETLSVALCARGRSLHFDGAGGAQASAQLIPRIRALLAEADVSLHDMQAIAFGRGPGAFTGLRTACAVAQGLAFGAGLPLLPLDSLLIVAEEARGVLANDELQAFNIDVAMDARMNEVYAGAYRWTGRGWVTRTASALYTLEASNEQWAQQQPHIVTGSALPAFGDALHTGGARRVAPGNQRAAALLRLARQCWHPGGGVAAADALPLYLRDKVALTTAQRAAAVASRS